MSLSVPNDIEALKELVINLLARVETLEAENKRLLAKTQLLEAENQELRHRLSATSRNSHRPPSSDGPKKQPAMPRKRGGAKGGKKGHKGDTLQMVAQADFTTPCAPEVCLCGQSLVGIETQLVERRQVYDLPEPKLYVTEYQRLVCRCPSCRRQVSGSFPAGVNAPVQYGNGVRTLSTLLSVRGCMSFEKIEQFFADIFGQPINVGTLYAANQKTYVALEQPEREIVDRLRVQTAVHFDETGARVEGQLHWMHTASTADYTYLFVHKGRGKKALRSEYSLLPKFTGWAVHDCLSSYFRFEQCRHSVCGSHLLRELLALEEQQKKWAKAFRQYLLLLYEKTKQGRNILIAALRPWAERRYDELLALARAEEPPPEKIPNKRGRAKGTKGYNLLVRLEKYRSAVLAFAYHRQVPFTNNQAERDLRPTKIKQKMAGCFRTLHGARIYARIQGFISTVQKHGLNVFKELKAALDGSPYSFAPEGS